MAELTEKSIGELLGKRFFIPSYQRGYRWTERQVEDLLDDIDSFEPKQAENPDNKTWYCLQPVVVKKYNEKAKGENNSDEEHTWYEVIDGQQRLTSIFLLIHYANEMWIGKQKTPEFEIKYATRVDSSEFLVSQEVNEDNQVLIDNSNVDYWHISKAYNKIHNWVKEYKEKHGKDFDNNSFQSKLKSYSKVIWYEIESEKDAIEIFTRINMGKIPLTNAELIKALFLNSSNFSDSVSKEIRLRQLEIASEWDRIEYSLQNDEFWYFINNTKNNLSTRIEYIFNIIKDIDGIENGNDQYATFRFFSDKFKSETKEQIDKNWKIIKRTFQTIEEWFNDRELYHKVGFLISTGEKITDLLKYATDSQKHTLRDYLENEIFKKVQCDHLEGLEYGNSKIKSILLLHNINTMLANQNETSRFPFDRYKNEKWDIEHIHAIATEVKVNKENLREWLGNNYVASDVLTNSELNTKIKKIIREKCEISDEERETIISYVLGEVDNSLANLCLLDRGTNRSYKNDAFKKKRNKIIENEKLGTFIPVCTRNVFMKYYSKELKDLELWNDEDRNDYFKNIKNTLKINN